MQTNLETKANLLWQTYEKEDELFWKKYEKILTKVKTQFKKTGGKNTGQPHFAVNQALQKVYQELNNKEIDVWTDTRTLHNDLLIVRLVLGLGMFCSIFTLDFSTILSVSAVVVFLYTITYVVLSTVSSVSKDLKVSSKLNFEARCFKFTKENNLLVGSIFYDDIISFSKKSQNQFVIKVKTPFIFPIKYRFSVANLHKSRTDEINRIYSLLQTMALLNRQKNKRRQIN